MAVWNRSEENSFRSDVVELFRVAGPLPRKPQLMPFPDDSEGLIGQDIQRENVLPFEIEENLATGFALVAANSDLTQAISACCVEQQRDAGDIFLRIARNQGVAPDAQKAVKSLLGLLRPEAWNGRYVPWLLRR